MSRALLDNDERVARLAAQMVPAYGHILAIGADSRAIEPYLPAGCTLVMTELAPGRTEADVAVLLAPDRTEGPEKLADMARRLGRPLIFTWPLNGADDKGFSALRDAMRNAGLRMQCGEQIPPGLGLFKWVPDRAAATAPKKVKRVLVLSYFHIANFGDRLGYHVLNSLLPADVEVVHAPLAPFAVPEADYDLLIIGIGNSLLPKDACNPELVKWLDRIPRAIGIFGTQYRDQYLYPEAARALDHILDKATSWWARYEEDIFAFGRGRANVRHLGDWLIAACPMAVPQLDKALTVPPGIISVEVPLDRTIQQIQAYRGVQSARLHPLLCAFTSADEVAYLEQHSSPADQIAGVDFDQQAVSGKFRSLLYDVFGRTFEEDVSFPVDRAAVSAYKRKVQTNMEALRAELFSLLGRALPPTAGEF